MDTLWHLVAEYLLRHNPTCQHAKRGGALVACVSHLHKEAVDVALRVHAAHFTSMCSRPISVQFNNREYHLCMECPYNFECDDPDEFEVTLGTKICPCVDYYEDVATKNIRSTICLFKTASPCPSCNYGYSDKSFQFEVRRLVHNKDSLNWCHDSSPPRICMDCGFTSLYE